MLTKPHTTENIDRFLEDYFSSNLAEFDRSHDISEAMYMSSVKIDMLNKTKKLEYLDFYSYLQDDAVDKVVFAFNSSELIDDRFAHRARIFDNLAMALREKFGMHTLLMASYDVGRVRMDEGFFNDPNFSTDTVYVIPAKQTKGPYLKFPDSRDWNAENVLSFIETHIYYQFYPAGADERMRFAQKLDSALQEEAEREADGLKTQDVDL